MIFISYCYGEFIWVQSIPEVFYFTALIALPLPQSYFYSYTTMLPPLGPKKVQLVTAEVGNGVFISGVMTKVNGQLAILMDIGKAVSDTDACALMP